MLTFNLDLPSLVPSPPAAVSVAPAPKPRRGRIKISSSRSSTTHYVSKSLPYNNRVSSTSSIAGALEFEWSISSDGLQTLSIPEVSCTRLWFLP